MNVPISSSQPKGGSRQKAAVTTQTFRSDPMYPRIARVVAEILRTGKVVAAVDVLQRMDLLTCENLEAWRLGQVPYLERVVTCNLTRLGRLLRILRMHVHDLCLVPSMTAYMKHGKGPRVRLRFSKTGDPGVEKAYARHFVWPGKSPFPLERLNADGSPKPKDEWPRRVWSPERATAPAAGSTSDREALTDLNLVIRR